MSTPDSAGPAERPETSVDATVVWALGWLQAKYPTVKPGDVDAVNAAFHRAIDVEPCATACTHVLFDAWTALGVANVVSRHAWRFLSIPPPAEPEPGAEGACSE